MRNGLKFIAIAYDLHIRHAAEIFSGASDYVASHRLNWQLLPLNFGFEAQLMELAGSGRLGGAIGTFASDAWLQGLTSKGVAAVNLFNFSKIESVPSVCLDDARIGAGAARHLVEQGARNFAFIGQDHVYFNQIRRKSFSEHCPEGRYHTIHPLEPRRAQVKRLGELETPIGVLCADDRIARELCNEAKTLGMDSGSDLLIIGIGNEPAESTFAGLGLTSFDIPARKMGYAAARQMDALFRPGTQELPRRQNFDAILVPRESTLSSPQARLAERALAYISEHMMWHELDVAYLCRQLGVSRRALELSTRQQFKKSPHQILSEARLKRAKEQLLQTNHAIGKVGEACGYPEPHHFSAWFKKRTGVAPKCYRLSAREKDSAPFLK
ncbi:MAG: substrate-binding domain-containing protein [Opitutales bacterium]